MYTRLMLSMKFEYQTVNPYSIRKGTPEVRIAAALWAGERTYRMCGNQLLTQIQSSYDCSCQGDFNGVDSRRSIHTHTVASLLHTTHQQ